MHRLFGSEFRMPLVVLACLAVGAIPGWSIMWVLAIAIGLGKITWDSIGKIRNGKYSLDYIAFLAMIVSLPAEQYLAGVIIVKPNELIPLDGVLRSDEALLNEANLTGEALPVTIARNTFIKSGNVNIGELIEISVEGSFETSTYMRIVRLVEDAKKHQAYVVRLAEKVNFPFTALQLLLAGGAFLFSDELSRALAVLVIAT